MLKRVVWHVSRPVLDEELDSHGYFTIWLQLNQENGKFNSWSGQKFQKGQIFKIYFWKQRHVSDVESPQQPNGTIISPVHGLKLLKNAFKGMTSSLGQKHPFWGSKMIASSWNLAHWLKTGSYTTYPIPVFENFEVLILWSFFQKNHFLKFWWSKSKISKIW